MPDLQPHPATHTPDGLSTATSARDDASGTDALAHLAKMSGTGSTFGSTDYVAINPTAVAALIIGFAGALSLLVTLFLFLPIVGIGCGLLAIRQIRNSNGTQAGYGFAIGGIFVSLIIGGVVGAREVRDWLTVRAETHEVAALISRFGKEVRAGNYDNAYDGLTSEDFRTRTDRATFGRTFEELQHIPGYGPLESIEWNKEDMLIEDVVDLETRVTCLALMKCRDMKEPGREYIRVSNKDGPWRIAAIPRLFPEKKPTRGGPG